MIKEYVVKITNKVLPNAFTLFEKEYSPELEIVRCKDCKYHFVDGDNVCFNMCLLNHNKVQSDDWFCADGERKESGEVE